MTDDGMLGGVLGISALSLDDEGRASSDLERSAEGMSLEEAENVVLRWAERPDEMLAERSTEEFYGYLMAVDKLLQAGGPAASIRTSNLASAKLRDELKHLLSVHSECVDWSWLPESFSAPSFGSTAGGGDEEEAGAGSSREQSFIIDLLPPSVVADLSDIASRMVALGRSDECVEAYVAARKGILEDSMYLLGVERVGADEIQRMQWEVLEPRLKKWIKGMRASFRVLLVSERCLCCDVFVEEGQEGVRDSCFAQLANGTALQMLRTLAEVAVCPESPERMFKLLDCYEMLQEVMPEIESSFQGEVPAEATKVLTLLKDAVKGTFDGLKSAIENDSSRTAAPAGALHPLTRYVMNYLGFLSEYLVSLKEIYRDEDGDLSANDDSGTFSAGLETIDDESNGSQSALAVKMQQVLDALLRNVDEHSRMYKDPALGIVFLMNNIYYIVQKAKASEQTVISDEWVRRQSSMVRYHAMSYQRTAWGRIFSYLRDEGIRTGYSNVSKEVLKDRFKSFNAAFEDIHRTQSTWVVFEPKLRDELRLLIADKLLPAYRSFLGRYRSHLETVRHSERYLKYTVEDLEGMLNDLFQGATASMSRRRSLSGS